MPIARWCTACCCCCCEHQQAASTGEIVGWLVLLLLLMVGRQEHLSHNCQWGCCLPCMILVRCARGPPVPQEFVWLLAFDDDANEILGGPAKSKGCHKRAPPYLPSPHTYTCSLHLESCDVCPNAMHVAGAGAEVLALQADTAHRW